MNYRIEPDANSWNLCKRRITQDGPNAGQESWAPMAYCGNLEQAARRMLEEVTKETVNEMNDGAAPSIRELIDAVRCAGSEVAAAVRAMSTPGR